MPEQKKVNHWKQGDYKHLTAGRVTRGYEVKNLGAERKEEKEKKSLESVRLYFQHCRHI
jgi:hypothetical protein